MGLGQGEQYVHSVHLVNCLYCTTTWCQPGLSRDGFVGNFHKLATENRQKTDKQTATKND